MDVDLTPINKSEGRAIIEAIARMDAKIDNLSQIVPDHEARLRAAENSVILYKESHKEHEVFRAKISDVERVAEANSKSLENLRKITWVIVVAVVGGIVTIIFDNIKKGH